MRAGSTKPSGTARWTACATAGLLLILSSGPGLAGTARAGSTASKATLVDRLHEKEILTDEEYQELQPRERRIDKMLDRLGGLHVGTLSYFDFSAGKRENDASFNRFQITRGYINIQMKLTAWLAFRITPDTHQDDAGDFKVRLKYLYALLVPPDVAFLTDMKAEVGLGHMPWLDFEEHINPYRCQGTMFVERAGLFNSADLGVSIGGLFGGQMPMAYQAGVSKYSPGRWGSWHIGVYNGAGYHAEEENENKIPEVRVSVRPLPGILPGLQVHYFGLFGRGNKKNVLVFPDFNVNLAMLSYQNAWIIFTGQYVRTIGNQKGTLVVPGTDEGLRGEGFSFFVNGRLPVLQRSVSLFARYDHFNPDRNERVSAGDAAYDLVLGGAAWEFYHHWLLLLVYERVLSEENSGGIGKVPVPGNDLADDWRVQTVLQMKF